MKTYATHPGRVKAEILRVLVSYPTIPLVLIGVEVVGITLLLVLPFYWILLGFAVAPLLCLIFYIGDIRPRFRDGDVCLGVVVSEEPLLVAYMTDMSTDISGRSPPYPAVKICAEPRSRFADKDVKLGRPIAGIARYGGKSTNRHHDFFEPLAVQCATSNESEVARVLSEISQERWQELQERVRKLPHPFRPGLYRCWTDWK
jgi:hypothetical protein